MKFYIYISTLSEKDSIGNIIKQMNDYLIKLKIPFMILCLKNYRKDLINVKEGLSLFEGLFFLFLSKKEDIHWFHYPIYYPLMELIRFVRGIKVVEYHGVTPLNLWKYKNGKEIIIQSEKKRELLNNSDLIITHSKFTYEELKQYLGKKTKNLVIPIATDMKKFKKVSVPEIFYKKWGVKKSDKIMLTVGRYSYHKRIEIQIRAMKKVINKFKNAKLLIVGNTNDKPYDEEFNKCKKLAEKLKISENIIFINKVSEKELIQLYNISSIYILSSLHEGFCMPIIEAMACKKPVIGPNIAAIPETMGDAGILFKPDDYADLSKKIILLLKNKKIYSKLSKKSLINAKEKNMDLKKFKDLINEIRNMTI